MSWTQSGRDFVQSLTDYEGAYVFGHDYEVVTDAVESAVGRIEAEAARLTVEKVRAALYRLPHEGKSALYFRAAVEQRILDNLATADVDEEAKP